MSTPPSKPTVAFLGTGAMGRRMASHLVDAFDLVVYNRTTARTAPLTERGARIATTPADAVRGAAVVISMLTDDDAARAVWLDGPGAALDHVAPDALLVECSTVTPPWIDALGTAADARGTNLIDAPVVGTLPHAEGRQLTFLAGGAQSALDRARPVLEQMGARVVHAGPRGRGALLKLLVNALFTTQVAQLAELLTAAERLGYPLEKAAEHLASLPAVAPAAQGALALMVADDHAPRFPITLVAKDLRYAAALGAVPVTDAARRVFEASDAAGLGGHNLTAVLDPVGR